MDWAYGNAFLRSFLGLENYGLGSMWHYPGINAWPPSRQNLLFERLALGETIASEFLRTMNEDSEFTYNNIFISWQGDLTLRLQILAPPSNLNGNDGTTVNLTWNASPEAAQYWVYRSTGGLGGPWTRLTTGDPIDTTSYTDSGDPPGSGAPSGPKLYQVRALKLTTTASGSYTNLSMGIFKAVN